MNAREAAFKVVHEVLFKKGYSNIALDEMLNRDFDSRDAGFITEIVLGTLRNKMLLENIISIHSKIKIKKISPSVMSVLLIGAYQIIFMDRTPNSAACNESVKLAAKFSGGRARGFANAVLRAITRDNRSLEEYYRHGAIREGEYNCNKYSICPSAYYKLVKQFGESATVKILENINLPARPCIRFNDDENALKHKVILKDNEIPFEKGKIAASAFYPDLNGPVSELDIYKKGIISLQDEGAQAMGLFASPQPGSEVLDACASPGGKTAHMAALMNGNGMITACDIHTQRVTNMKNNLSRIRFRNFKFMEKDMSVNHKDFKDKFDTVLVDVPCSGIGTAQRRPEIKLFYKEDPSLYKLQGAILKSCSEYVKPGGHIIYGTCTLFKEENREIVDMFLSSSDEFTLEDEKTILPDGRTGGFYMAKLARQS